MRVLQTPTDDHERRQTTPADASDRWPSYTMGTVGGPVINMYDYYAIRASMN